MILLLFRLGEHLEGDAVALGVGDRLLAGVELRRTWPSCRWTGSSPSAGSGSARRGRLELQHPLAWCWPCPTAWRSWPAEDAREHERSLARLRAASMVGAAGFEPATLCSQSRCATRLRHAPRSANEAPSCHAPAAARNARVSVAARRRISLKTPRGARQVAAGDVGAALDEGDVAAGPGDPRLADHPLPARPMSRKSTDRCTVTGVAPAARPAAPASRPSRKAESMPPWIRPTPLQCRASAKNACSDALVGGVEIGAVVGGEGAPPGLDGRSPAGGGGTLGLRVKGGRSAPGPDRRAAAPISAARPPRSSSTPRTSPPEGIGVSDIGVALRAMETMRPSGR